MIIQNIKMNRQQIYNTFINNLENSGVKHKIYNQSWIF